jgi:hypothetical protein
MEISRRLRLDARLIAPSLAWFLVSTLLIVSAISVASAQSGSPETVVYRLKETSGFQRGCFAPCLCPVMESGSERGTFLLTFTGNDGLFSHYRVDEVIWKVATPGGELRVTGSGSYRVGGEFAVQHQLELDLKVGDRPIEHYDSGLVVGGGDFPAIAISISVHGQVCFDTLFRIEAAPVPPDQIRSYRLIEGSTFQRGCFGICDCAVGEPLPMWGGFSLVQVTTNSLFTEYSVVQAKWQVGPDPASGTASLPVTGFGDYRLGGEFATEQRMELDLRVGTETPAFFDSGNVAGGEDFPRIVIELAHDDNSCVKTIFNVHARPIKVQQSRAIVSAEEPGR